LCFLPNPCECNTCCTTNYQVLAGKIDCIGANQEEEPTAEPMDLIPYNPPEDRGPVYSHFERMVLNQLHELNVSQHEHHNYCNERFNALDGQIHDIHDMLHSFQTRNDPQDD